MMCGIVGIVGEANKELISRMCDVIEHRGPDDFGIYIDKNLSLGMRRLSIIDLAGGKQPVHNEDETVWVIYNGEIYNYLELKKELESLGHRFYTKCDTEIFVHAYEQYGELFVEKLRGMFAFAIWDIKAKKLVIGRDRLGKKPLYYTVVNGNLVFASEIKSILQHPEVKRSVNFRALHHFLSFQYVPGPDTMFDGIYKLQPGHILVHQNNNITTKKYWDIEFSNSQMDENYYTTNILELLKESVKIRLMSEVPLGVYLSGGLDSSSIVALMSQIVEEPVKTFTVGFGQTDDELGYARLVAEKFGTDHKELMVRSDFNKILPDVVWHFDEPTADPAALPTYQMSEITKPYATVILVGEGGDEAFAGYPKYSRMIKVSKYSKVLSNAVVKALLRPALGTLSFVSPNNKMKNYFDFMLEVLKTSNSMKDTYFRFSLAGFDEDEKKELYGEKEVEKIDSTKLLESYFNGNGLLNSMLHFDFNVWLCDKLLMKVDKMTMAFSIEARAPFMDHKLIEFSNTMPQNLRLDKYAFRKSMVGILPKEILARKKQGFNVPIASLLNNELKEISSSLLSEFGKDSDFNYDYITKHVLKHPNNRRHNSQIWNLMFYRLWYKTFIEREKVDGPISLRELTG